MGAHTLIKATKTAELLFTKLPLNCHVDVVDLLIKGGADCNRSDKDGRTPLHEGCWRVDVVDLLIKGGADCNQSDKKAELLFT